MGKGRARYRCGACGQISEQWSGRCLSCGGWGQVEEVIAPVQASGGAPAQVLGAGAEEVRIPTGSSDLDRVWGGGIVRGSVTLLAGPPGIGKSTLLLQLLAGMADGGQSCLLASGEESRGQVASRARRVGVNPEVLTFTGGRILAQVVAAARDGRPAVLAVDSIQTMRDPGASQVVGGVAQVRLCADALVEVAKELDVAVIMTGHVTKDGDLAGPKALEHAVDVVLAFDGDARSGLRTLTSTKNRFGAEGETAWFEMRASGLAIVDPSAHLVIGDGGPGAALALPVVGRRAVAVEVQALVGSLGAPRRQVTGMDLRRFQQVAAVIDRASGVPLATSELFGAVPGGLRLDDPACDLAIAAALVSAATGVPAPAHAAFVGELGLTGTVRPAPGLGRRLAAARAAGCRRVYGPAAPGQDHHGLEFVSISHVGQSLTWASEVSHTGRDRHAS